MVVWEISWVRRELKALFVCVDLYLKQHLHLLVYGSMSQRFYFSSSFLLSLALCYELMHHILGLRCLSSLSYLGCFILWSLFFWCLSYLLCNILCLCYNIYWMWWFFGFTITWCSLYFRLYDDFILLLFHKLSLFLDL